MTKKILFISILTLCACGLFSQQTDVFNTYIELKKSVIDFREDGIPECFRDGKLVNPSPADLKVGDVFIDVDGNARLVTDIQEIDGELYIDTVQPDLSLVVNYAEIPEQSIAFTEDNFLPETLAGGDVSSVNTVPSSRGASNFGMKAKFERVFNNKSKSASVKIGGTSEVSGTVSISAQLPYIKRWRRRDGYINGSLTYNLSVGSYVTVSAQKGTESKDNRQMIYGFGTPGPVEASLGVFIEPLIEGSIELTIPLTVALSGESSAGCALGGLGILCYPKDVYRNGGSELVISISPTVEASGKMTAKVYLGSFVTLFGVSVYELEAGGGEYFKLSGKIDFGSLEYKTSEKRIKWNSEDAKISATGELGVCCKIAGSVFDGKWGFELMNYEYPFITFGIDTKTKKFYYASPYKIIPSTSNESIYLIDGTDGYGGTNVIPPSLTLVPASVDEEGEAI